MTKKHPRKITAEQTDDLIASARTRLEKEASWIRRSAMLERVYFLGVFAGLQGIANEEDLKGLLIRVWAGTCFKREFDNTFASTQMGKAFETLDRHLRDTIRSNGIKLTAIPASVTEALETLGLLAMRHEEQVVAARRDIYDMLDRLHEALKHVHEPAAGGPVDPRSLDDAFSTLEHLQDRVRLVALLETDHNRWKGLSEE